MASITHLASPLIGVVTPPVGVASPLVGFAYTNKKASSSPAVQDPGDEDCLSGMLDTGAGGYVLYRDAKPKDISSFPKELVLSVSPDSGTEMSVTVPVERDQVEMEPVGVSGAREAVAMLVAANQKLNTQHQRMEKMLRENRSSVTEIKKVKLKFGLI